MKSTLQGSNGAAGPLPLQPKGKVQSKALTTESRFISRKTNLVEVEKTIQKKQENFKINKVDRALKSRIIMKDVLNGNHLVKHTLSKPRDTFEIETLQRIADTGWFAGGIAGGIAGVICGSILLAVTPFLGPLGPIGGLIGGAMVGSRCPCWVTSMALKVISTIEQPLADKEFDDIAKPPDQLVYPHKVPLMTELLEPNTDGLTGKTGKELKSAQKKQGKAMMKILRCRYPTSKDIGYLNETLKNLNNRADILVDAGRNPEQLNRFKVYVERYAEMAKTRAFPQVKALFDTWKTEFNKAGLERDRANKELGEVVNYLLDNSNSESIPALEYFLDEMRNAMAEIAGELKGPSGRDLLKTEDRKESSISDAPDEFMSTVGGKDTFEEVTTSDDYFRLFFSLREPGR